MKGLLAGVALAALTSGFAMAADMTPIFKAQPPVAVFSWTGCYLGGHIGGGWAIKTFNGPFAGTFPTSADANLLATVALSDISNDFDSSRFLGGGQIGCNYQIAPNWVLGIEGDASWTSLTANKLQSETTTGAFFFPPSTTVPFSANSTGTLFWKTDFIWTLTGRLGYTADRTMIYVKGGAAWARDDYQFNGQVSATRCDTVNGQTGQCERFTLPFTTPFGFAASETRPGWTFGGGIEWAFWANWSVKVEYDYLDLGRRKVTFLSSTQAPVNVDITQRIQEVKLGINYRFGPSLFVANY